MDVATATAPRPGQPRSERDAAFLQRFDARIQLPIVVSAILPLLIIPEDDGWVGVVVGVATWLVFLLDYVVHERHLEHYGRTRLGRFDLLVVVATAPWFLFPGAQAGQFVVLLRLARLARLLMATRGARRLFERLGRVALLAGGVLVVSSLVAYHAEHPVNPEFATVGDSFWWGIVTLTTVGYGDIVPKTTTGRWVAIVIMITGIAVLGLLAGSLASFFRLDNGKPADGSSPADEAEHAAAAATSSDAALQALAAEVSALRYQVEALAARLTGALPGQAPQEPAGDEESAGLLLAHRSTPCTRASLPWPSATVGCVRDSRAATASGTGVLARVRCPAA
ncbi:MAG TPA: potassium channel family protein [Streptosporangiaceae bacterium]|nr:potassium channel family protein [Streptosporangiaceae bacterium]